MWISLAADAGFEPSQMFLPTLVQKMTPDQVALGKKKAEEWKKAHGA